MRNRLAVVGGVVFGLLGVGLAVVGGGYAYLGSAAQARLGRTWPEVKGKDIPIPFPLTEAEIEALRQEALAALPPPVEGAEPAAPVDPLAGVDLQAIAMDRAVARGKVLVGGRLPCTECHGQDGGGTLIVDAQPVWTWYAPNITRGGRTKDYAPSDWDRIVRHGVKKDGTTATMPAVDFMSLSDQEVSDLAAFFTSLEPKEAAQPDTVIGPVGRMLLATGTMPLSAELIDHAKVNPVYPPDPALTVEYGGHVAATCVGCHRVDFSGGPIAQGPPDWPPAKNLTPAPDGLAGWTEGDFLRVFHEGKKPDGTAVAQPMAMVTKLNVTDTELKAVFMYLQTIEAKPTGE